MQTDNIGFGGDLRRQGNRDVLEEKDTFRYDSNLREKMYIRTNR